MEPEYKTLVEISVSETDEVLMDQTLISLVKKTTEFVEEEVIREVMANELPKRQVLENKLAAWSRGIPWFITGGVTLFTGGVVIGLIVAKN